jgi:hypothetical protein
MISLSVEKTNKAAPTNMIALSNTTALKKLRIRTTSLAGWVNYPVLRTQNSLIGRKCGNFSVMSRLLTMGFLSVCPIAAELQLAASSEKVSVHIVFRIILFYIQ